MLLEDALTTSLRSVQSMLAAEPVSVDDLARPTPCASFDVHQLMDHIRDTHLLLTNAATAGSAQTTAPLSECHAELARAARAAWHERGQDGTVHLAGHDLPATFVLSLHVVETVVHGWDLAAALDRDLDLSDDLVDAVWQLVPGVAGDDTRGSDTQAAYGPAVYVHPATSSLNRMIAFTGRDPEWGSTRARVA